MDRFGSDFGSFGSDDEGAYDAFDDTAHSNPPPSPVGQDERRMQVRAYNHWVADLGDQDLPHIEALEPELIADFGPYSVLFDFSTGSETPTIQFIGSKLQAECRTADAIDTLEDIPPGSLLAQVADHYRKVVGAQAPVTFEAEMNNAQGCAVSYRGVLLPYSSDFDTIDFVYAVVNWKEVADAATAEALLSEIDAAIDAQAPSAEVIPFARDTDARSVPVEDNAHEAPPAWSSPAVLGFGDQSDSTPIPTDLPVPTFGTSDEELPVTDYTSFDNGDTPKRDRSVDALGNPIGGASPQEEPAAPTPSSIAAEYGLPEWDEEEDIDEDVDDLVNPLANIDLNSRLMSLVSSGSRGKKTVDLATLSDTAETEQDEEEERPLFKPKAPPVDTLLTPEAYDEDEDEDEAEWGFDAEVEEDADVEAVTEVEAASLYENAPPAIDVESLEDAPAHDHEAAPVSAAQDAGPDEAEEAEPESVFEIPSFAAVEPSAESEAETYGSDVFELEEIVDAEGEDEPVELVLDVADIVEDTPEEVEPVGLIATSLSIVDVSEEELAEAEFETEFNAEADFAVESEYDAATETEAEDVIELAEFAVVDDAFDASEEFDIVAATPEPVDVTPIADTAPPQPETLHGLLAAVNELAEAANTTQDQGRRALYEAVGRAFDASIKAVIASETAEPATVTPLPVSELAVTGPELALVMVRRHRNGETEVVGEVPHDEDLLARAQHQLARRGAAFG